MLRRPRRLSALLGVATTLMMSSPVAAQSRAHVAAGVDISKRTYFEDGFRQTVKPSFLYRIRRHRQPENGWRFRLPEFGFNWFSADVEMPVAGQDTEIGHLNVRPFLGGIGETLVMKEGKDELSFTLLAGPAFSKFTVSSEARAAYRLRLNADPVAIDAKNTFVLRPGVSFWHDLSGRLGFHASVNYIIARPEVVVRTPSGESTSRWHADNIAFKAGIAVGIR
jgi:hypothetical protein